MNSGIDFVIYVGPVGSKADDEVRRLHSQLNDAARARIKIMDFNDIVRSLGPSKKPSWLRGYPTMSSYESPPRVLEGTAVVNTLTQWVQQQQKPQMPAAQAGRPQQQQQQQQPIEIFQSSMGVGLHASIVDDSTYTSALENRSAATSNAPTRGGKISQSDIERFNQSRR